MQSADNLPASMPAKVDERILKIRARMKGSDIAAFADGSNIGLVWDVAAGKKIEGWEGTRVLIPGNILVDVERVYALDSGVVGNLIRVGHWSAPEMPDYLLVVRLPQGHLNLCPVDLKIRGGKNDQIRPTVVENILREMLGRPALAPMAMALQGIPIRRGFLVVPDDYQNRYVQSFSMFKMPFCAEDGEDLLPLFILRVVEALRSRIEWRMLSYREWWTYRTVALYLTESVASVAKGTGFCPEEVVSDIITGLKVGGWVGGEKDLIKAVRDVGSYWTGLFGPHTSVRGFLTCRDVPATLRCASGAPFDCDENTSQRLASETWGVILEVLREIEGPTSVGSYLAARRHEDVALILERMEAVSVAV